MVKLGVLRSQPTPNASQPTPHPSQEGRGSQESGGERITKINVVMAIEDFFYVQLNGFEVIINYSLLIINY
ncbi:MULTISPECIES: hypothetical protein [unclassified Okeania]|uniref:hypothetical protein n=1 Tax=unclassified Okeania TaxID=2634635 RepID=UPI0013B8FF88|nr:MULTISPECIES: hypothetical protein [unclassified Okeania]NET15547.1 hypothetical protein [Okeania sp. SIO1H6]NES74434.1 hypothetical protein [Okeania sp. SIO1H4]NES88306.1 hypothetical protein [Okeania sp. SIO2B9]NET18161.1 hypothetical protein [Okeania sp. SIO1H5]NET77418.1 hypothetical protein [Okeania sp. SIO1F9]